MAQDREETQAFIQKIRTQFPGEYVLCDEQEVVAHASSDAEVWEKYRDAHPGAMGFIYCVTPTDDTQEPASRTPQTTTR